MDDDIDDYAGEIIVRYSLDIKTIRVIDNVVSAGNWKLKADIIQDPEITPEENDIKISLLKVRYFFEEIISNGIIWCNSNEWASNAFLDDNGICTVGNIPILTPHDPTDDHLAVIFQSKMNAFAPAGMQFNCVELVPNDYDVSFLFVGDAEEVLPTIDEWVGPRSFFDKPWWARNDGSTIDITPNEDADLTVKPDYAFSLDFLGEHLKPKEIKDGKIIKPTFNPTIIKGGKED